MQSKTFIYYLTLLTSDKHHIATLKKLIVQEETHFEEVRRDMTTSFELYFDSDGAKRKFELLIKENLPALF